MTSGQWLRYVLTCAVVTAAAARAGAVTLVPQVHPAHGPRVLAAGPSTLHPAQPGRLGPVTDRTGMTSGDRKDWVTSGDRKDWVTSGDRKDWDDDW